MKHITESSITSKSNPVHTDRIAPNPFMVTELDRLKNKQASANGSFRREQQMRDSGAEPPSTSKVAPNTTLDRLMQMNEMMDIRKNTKNLRHAREATALISRSPSLKSPDQRQHSASHHRSKSAASVSQERRAIASDKDVITQR